MFVIFRRVLAGALLLGSLAACAVNPVSQEADFVFMSEREEIELGASYHKQVIARYGVYADPALQRYVNAVGQNLAAMSHRGNLDFHFTVLDTEVFNAFALPGGYVYVTRGLLAYLNTEAELAGVLGHEIGHVTARHAVRLNATNRVEGFFGALLFDHLGSRIKTAYRNFSSTLAQGYSREHELEADELAVEYLARAGHTPTAMDEVIALLRGREDLLRNQVEGAAVEAPIYHGLSSHPDTAQRAELIERVSMSLAEELPPPRADGRRVYRRHLRGLVFGPSAEQGRVIGDRYLHAPSRTGFDLPAGWKFDNSGTIIKMRSPRGDAVVQIVRERRPAATVPRTVLEQLPLIGALTDERPLLDDGVRGWAASTSAPTVFGDRSIRLAAWLSGETAWILIASANVPTRYQRVFETLIDSFHRLDDVQAELADPLRVFPVIAEAGTSFAKLAEESPLGRDAEARLRLLNGRSDGRGEPEPGEWIKIVQ